jgi:hypothetical protein
MPGPPFGAGDLVAVQYIIKQQARQAAMDKLKGMKTVKNLPDGGKSMRCKSN